MLERCDTRTSSDVMTRFPQASAGSSLRVVKAVFILLVLVTALCAGLHTVSDFDMGWHLATGRYVVQHQRIPGTDVLSFTSAGKLWEYPPFAGVLFYLVFLAFGYSGLSWVTALACVSVVGYLVRRRDLASCVLALLALQSIAARSAPRADLFSTVFFALFLGELWAYRLGLRARLWLLPVMMFLWVNLHPGFIAGLGVIAAYLLLEVADLPFETRREAALLRMRKAWPFLAASVAVTLLNPWGSGIYGVARALSGAGADASGRINSSSFIGEYQGVPVSMHLLKQLVDVRHLENGFTWLLLIAMGLIVLAMWRKQFGAAVLVAVALYAGLAHARYMALFAIVIVTVGGTLLGALCISSSSNEDSPSAERPLLRVPEAMATLLLVLLCGVAILHIVDYATSRTYVVFNSDWRFGAGESSWFPERAAAFIEREGLPGNIFEEYALGGYEAWRLGPPYPDFLDGRSDRLSPDLVAEQHKLYTADPDSDIWRASAEQWNLNVLMVAVSGFRSMQKLNPAAFCHSLYWRPVYMDDTALVFVRNVPQNRLWIDRLQINCDTQALTPPAEASRSRLYDFYFNSGALLLNLGRDSGSEFALRRASQLFPSDPNVHLLLAGLLQRQRNFSAEEQEFLTALSLEESSGTWFSLGQLYAYEGRGAEAVQAVKRAANSSAQPLDMYMYLAQLEIEQSHPEQALAAFAGAERSSPYRNGGESLAPELYAQIAEGRSEAHQLLGHWPQAVDLQAEAIRLNPGMAHRWARLAQLYETLGKTALAAEAERKARDLESQSQSHN